MPILSRTGHKFGVATVALLSVSAAAITSAHAGAFAVREQSAYFQGMSFAGSAAGDELSSMFWNSAAAAAVPGMNSESSISLVIPQSEITATDGLLLNPFVNPGADTHSGNIGDPTAVPASYANYQLNDRLFFGLATNSQYGFKTKPDHLDFAGTPIARTSDIFSINFNPNVAYKLTPELTIGVGAQIMYAKVRLGSDGVDLDGPGGTRRCRAERIRSMTGRSAPRQASSGSRHQAPASALATAPPSRLTLKGPVRAWACQISRLVRRAEMRSVA